MSRPIAPMDLMFLVTETPNSPKHVGAVLLFDLPRKGAQDIARRIVEDYRVAKPIAPFNSVAEMVGRTGPRWKTAQTIDMEHHVQHIALPAGSSYEAFLRLIEDLHEPVMDRNRPAFKVWVIEGLPGRQLALYFKIHHAIVDGMSAMMRITGSLATTPDGAAPAPFFALDMARAAKSEPQSIFRQLVNLNQTALRQTSALRVLSMGVLRKTLGRLRSRGDHGSVPFNAPHTVLNEPIRSPRSFATLALPLEDMRAVGKAYGGTINDVAAAIVDAGAHAYLKKIGHPTRKRLVAMCPISLREAGDTSATTKASAIFAPLAPPTASVQARLQHVIQATASGKDELRGMGGDAALLYGLSALGIGEAAGATGVGRVTGHLASFVLSNVPGSRTPLFLHGARLTGVYPVSALGAGVGLNVTLASHDGTMGFGFVANGMSLPQLPELAMQVQSAFEALKRAAKGRAVSASRKTPAVAARSAARIRNQPEGAAA
jgi:WS/DGAT/MGAT family acyltransferase